MNGTLMVRQAHHEGLVAEPDSGAPGGREIGSRGLDSIIDATDETVLQLHALGGWPVGLFDPYSAVWRTRAYSLKHAKKPFRISLPAYGYRVRFDARGNAFAVEAEMPADMAALVEALRADAREHAA